MRNNILIIWTTLFFIASVNAQNLLEYQIEYSPFLGVSESLTLDDGNIMMSCFSYPPSSDSAEAILVKLNLLNQEFTWAKRLKIFHRDDLGCISLLSDGNILVGGTARQDFATEVGGSVFKMDPEGNLIWHKVYTGSSDDRTIKMFENDSDQSLMIFIRYGVNNQPTKILHTDAFGNILSQRTYSIDGRGVFAEDITMDDSGNFYMAGKILNTTTSRYEYFICAVSTTSLLWYKRFDFGRSINSSDGIVVTSDGQLACAGWITDEINSTTTNAWIMKLDLNGNVAWTNEFGKANEFSEYFSGLLALENGNILALGGTSTITGSEARVIKTGSAGNVIWANSYDHFEAQGLYEAIYTSNNDRLFLRGSAPGSEITNTAYLLVSDLFGESACGINLVEITPTALTVEITEFIPDVDDPDVTANSPPVQIIPIDITVNQVCDDSTTSVTTLEQKTDLILYPVPSHHELNIILPNHITEITNLNIIDLYGNTVLSIFQNQINPINLDVSNLAPGIYWVKINFKDRTLRQKFIKI